MNQEKIGKFIAECRKEKGLTQRELSEQLGVSINAVSKWERGICLMDMALLKPLSHLLGISVVDILSGEKVEATKLPEKYEESIENVIQLNKVKSKSFGVYGMLLVFTMLIFYKAYHEICFYDIVAILCGFNTFKFAYKYTLDKSKVNLIISVISFLTCIFLLVEYIITTL